jgi:hypothetical protein
MRIVAVLIMLSIGSYTNAWAAPVSSKPESRLLLEAHIRSGDQDLRSYALWSGWTMIGVGGFLGGFGGISLASNSSYMHLSFGPFLFWTAAPFLAGGISTVILGYTKAPVQISDEAETGKLEADLERISQRAHLHRMINATTVTVAGITSLISYFTSKGPTKNDWYSSSGSSVDARAIISATLLVGGIALYFVPHKTENLYNRYQKQKQHYSFGFIPLPEGAMASMSWQF